MQLDNASLAKLQGVHPDLISIVKRAATLVVVPFIITEGLRSEDRQSRLLAAGASQTMRSRHLPNKDGLACAVDTALKINGEISWAWPPYADLARIFKRAARDLNLPIEWGGDWKTLKDGPHFQLPWNVYP